MFAACRLTTTRVGLLQGRGLSCSPAALRVSPRAVPRLLLVTSKARVQHPPRRASGAAAARNAAKPAAGLDAAATAAAAAAAAATALASSSTPLWAQPLFTQLQDIQDAVEELQDGVKGLRSSAARQETSLGSIFEVTMRGMPRENRVRPLMRSLAQLLAAVGLPASNGALDPAHAQLAQVSGCCSLWRPPRLSLCQVVGCVPTAKACQPVKLLPLGDGGSAGGAALPPAIAAAWEQLGRVHPSPPYAAALAAAPALQMSVLHALRAQLINKFGKARCMQVCSGWPRAACWGVWS